MSDAPDPNDPYSRLSYRRLIAWPARIQREAPFLREVLAGGPSKRLLDLGCGTGEHARFLQEEGFEVTGVDASEAQLAQAREAGPGPEFVKGDLAALGDGRERPVRRRDRARERPAAPLRRGDGPLPRGAGRPPAPRVARSSSRSSTTTGSSTSA